MDKLRGSGGT
uniref:Uncharacterized protein n=1 Tax=Anguilla anguilla TaxID=7936 RepID=A0A0E9RQY6_ANGAN